MAIHRSVLSFLNWILGFWRWISGSFDDRHRAWLHLPFCRWKLRQRRHCHILHAAHILLLDQSCWYWNDILVHDGSFSLLLHGLYSIYLNISMQKRQIMYILTIGVFVGRLCIFDQFNPDACAHFDDHRAVFAPRLCSLLHIILCRNYSVDADQFRRIPTGPKLRTYAGEYENSSYFPWRISECILFAFFRLWERSDCVNL